MKLFYSTIVLLFSINVFALDIKPITNQRSATEILDVLTTKLNVYEDRRGDSPESGCYNIRVHSLLGMDCHSADCTAKSGFEREPNVACYFDQVESADDFKTIKGILKSSGLNSKNVLFRR